MKNWVFCIGLFMVLGGPCFMPATYSQTSSDHAYVTDLDLALRLSKDTKQEVVVIFSASWCNFCNLLKKDLPNLSGFDNKIICILDTDEEKRLARQFKVKTLPTSVRLNSNGVEISRITGYNKTQYSEWLETK
jgi:thioredoxin-like negative regulator of GroEL